mgnify:CR=1 FL=1
MGGLLEDPDIWNNPENAQKLGKEKRISFSPAVSNNEAAEAACPIHIVIILEEIYCIVSYIAKPDQTIPPGELI